MDDVAVAVAEHLDLDVARATRRSVSMKTRSSPKEDSRLASAPGSSPRATSSAFQAMRMPLPPPPAEALIITGKPTRAPRRAASASVITASGWPGTMGTPASAASFFEAILSPIAPMARGFGPMKAMPAAAQRLGEVGVLGEEAVAGMDRVGAGRLGRRR